MFPWQFYSWFKVILRLTDYNPQLKLISTLPPFPTRSYKNKRKISFDKYKLRDYQHLSSLVDKGYLYIS